MRKVICIYFSLACLSCGVVDFSPSNSIKVNPSEYNQILEEDEDIFVKFNFTPDHVSAQSAFEIQAEGGRVAGLFKWNNNTMIFIPQDKFEPAHRYSLKYAGEVSDTSGKEHTYNIYTPFFYKTRQPLKTSVSRINPSDGSTIQARDRVTFSFSVPMLPSSFLKGFSIYPEIECDEEWNEDYTRLSLTPKEEWQEHQVYCFSFSDKIISAEGVSLADSRTFSLYSCSGAVLPTVLSVDTALNDGLSYPVLFPGLEGVKGTDAIRVSFSVPMDVSDTEAAFSIIPDIPGHTCWISDSVMVFVPEEEWKWETRYSVAIAESAKSQKGLYLPDQFEISFTPDITLLKLIRMEGKISDGFPLTAFNSSQEVDIDVGDALMPENIYTFSFIFNHEFTKDEDKEKIFSGIKIRGIFPPAIVSPKVMSFFWTGDSTLQITYTGFVPEGRIYSMDVDGLEKVTLRTR